VKPTKTFARTDIAAIVNDVFAMRGGSCAANPRGENVGALLE